MKGSLGTMNWKGGECIAELMGRCMKDSFVALRCTDRGSSFEQMEGLMKADIKMIRSMDWVLCTGLMGRSTSEPSGKESHMALGLCLLPLGRPGMAFGKMGSPLNGSIKIDGLVFNSVKFN